MSKEDTREKSDDNDSDDEYEPLIQVVSSEAGPNDFKVHFKNNIWLVWEKKYVCMSFIIGRHHLEL